MTGAWLTTTVLFLVSTPAGRSQSIQPRRERNAIVRMLSDNSLRSGHDPGFAIALVLVKSVRIQDTGSRNENVSANLAIERIISGTLPPTVEAWRFSSKDNTRLVAGRHYLILLGSFGVKAPVPDRIDEFVEVPEGSEEEAVKRHIQAFERVKKGMRRLSDDSLRACEEEDTAIALVQVRSVQIQFPGTRSESASIDFTVERTFCGVLPPTVKAWRYTIHGNTLVTPGQRYVVVLGLMHDLKSSPDNVACDIGEFVEVPEGREEEAVQLHLQALEALKKTKR